MELETLRHCIVEVFPELSSAKFTLLTAGWDCVAVDVDDRLIFKFPRDEEGQQGLVREARLLDVVRPLVTLPVPELRIHTGPPLFSCHQKIQGEHLLTEQYHALPDGERGRLAADLALFYGQLHSADKRDLEAAGARTIEPWLSAEEILRRVCPILPDNLRAYAERKIEAWERLPPDPHGTIYGFFDGHGCNMAFDHAKRQLNGIYDFGDSGFGALHQEFIYSNWIAPDLTERIVSEYELLTGLALDRERIELLSSMIRLAEVAESGDDPVHGAMIWQSFLDWAER